MPRIIPTIEGKGKSDLYNHWLRNKTLFEIIHPKQMTSKHKGYSPHQEVRKQAQLDMKLEINKWIIEELESKNSLKANEKLEVISVLEDLSNKLDSI